MLAPVFELFNLHSETFFQILQFIIAFRIIHGNNVIQFIHIVYVQKHYLRIYFIFCFIYNDVYKPFGH